MTNVYGPGPPSSSNDRGILNLMVNKALNGDTLTIFGEGKFLRDYIFIDDVISTFLKAPIHIKDLIGKHFVLGSGEGTTIRDAFILVADIVRQITGIKVNVESVDIPDGMEKIEFRNFIAKNKTLSEIGLFEEMHDLSDGISKTVKYFIKTRKKT